MDRHGSATPRTAARTLVALVCSADAHRSLLPASRSLRYHLGLHLDTDGSRYAFEAPFFWPPRHDRPECSRRCLAQSQLLESLRTPLPRLWSMKIAWPKFWSRLRQPWIRTCSCTVKSPTTRLLQSRVTLLLSQVCVGSRALLNSSPLRQAPRLPRPPTAELLVTTPICRHPPASFSYRCFSSQGPTKHSPRSSWTSRIHQISMAVKRKRSRMTLGGELATTRSASWPR